MEQAAESVGDLAKVAKINVDDNRSLGPQFGVRGIPALLIFKNGKVVEEVSPRADLVQALLAHAQ